MFTQTENPAAASETPGKKTGRFQVGNPGGPGNPFARQVADLRKDILNYSTPEKIRALTDKIYTMAIEGCISAAKLFLSYAVGKPQPVIDPDQLDIEEWKIFRETAPMKEECAILGAAGSPHTHLSQVRILRPLVTGIMEQQVLDFCGNGKKNLEEKLRPSPNGVIETPSAQGNGAPPSPNGVIETPSALGNGAPPSPNGVIETPSAPGNGTPPLSNGVIDTLSAFHNGPPPSPNGMRERKLRSKARRQAKKHAQSSTIGSFYQG